jgi:AAA domain
MGPNGPWKPTDILIVTPYNAQIRAIQTALTASGQTAFRVGTVDKFQGPGGPGGHLLDGHRPS